MEEKGTQIAVQGQKGLKLLGCDNAADSDSLNLRFKQLVGVIM